jgi:GTP cyclohydrolase FolE2
VGAAGPRAAALGRRRLSGCADTRRLPINRVGIKDIRHPVTERAYENPKFVEDLVRDVATWLNAEPRVADYVVEAENFESIHNHSAYARIERSRNA